MSQYNNLKILIKRKARTSHKCFSCGEIIKKGDIYYSEELKDRFINYPHKKKFCADCYKNYANTERKNN